MLMVVAEISRDDDNHALLPVLQDVAHLHHKFKNKLVQLQADQPPPPEQHSGQESQAGRPLGEVSVKRGLPSLGEGLGVGSLLSRGLQTETKEVRPGSKFFQVRVEPYIMECGP